MKSALKQISIIFFVGLAFNFAWENLHSVLYLRYQGGEITKFILLRASFADAILIVLIFLPFYFFVSLENQIWFFIPLSLVVAAIIEFFALEAGRWQYASSMPILPILDIGLSPFVQLALTGWAAKFVSERFKA